MHFFLNKKKTMACQLRKHPDLASKSLHTRVFDLGVWGEHINLRLLPTAGVRMSRDNQ